jgi:hypothetical protein
MINKSKAELLAHYADKDPRVFHQFDGWCSGDDVVGCDEDGHGLTAQTTWELMGGGNVRVLIPVNTTPTLAVTLLRKIAGWIERDAEKIIGWIDGADRPINDMDVFDSMRWLLDKDINLDDRAAVTHALIKPGDYHKDPKTSERFVSWCIKAARANKAAGGLHSGLHSSRAGFVPPEVD